MAILLTLINKVIPIPIKICCLYFFFTEISKLIHKLIWNCKGQEEPTQSLKKNQVEGLRLPDISTYYKATIVKAVWTISIPEKENGKKNGIGKKRHCVIKEKFFNKVRRRTLTWHCAKCSVTHYLIQSVRWCHDQVLLPFPFY